MVFRVGFYKQVAPLGLAFAHRPPGEILKAIGQVEAEIQQGVKELRKGRQNGKIIFAPFLDHATSKALKGEATDHEPVLVRPFS